MKYIVSWTLPQATNRAAIARFLETGGAPPAGIRMLGRWHGMSGSGFAVAESDNDRALFLWQLQWSDLLPLAITPCVEDETAGAVMASLGKT